MKPDYKKDFPELTQMEADGRPLAYLDNAATTQKPFAVIEAVDAYYRTFNANTHRGVYSVSSKATQVFEEVREKVARFIGAGSADEIVFTSGTTDSLNLVALSYGMSHVEAGDEILISVMEHHSNLLPWQRIAKLTGATLRYLYPDSDGQLVISEVKEKLNAHTKIVALTQISNVLGSLSPIGEIAALVHAAGAVLVMDGAQSVPHIPVDVRDLDVDFMAFSGHKMLAPAGIGVLYGKKDLLDAMEPLRLGGGIVARVREQSVSFLDAPAKFEAGTQNVEGVIGLGAAIDYIEGIGFDAIEAVENHLTDYALKKMRSIPNVEIYGAKTGKGRTGILAFNVRDIHPHDTASILAADDVAVRAGHHCAQPLMDFLGVNATCRMSLYFYNTEEDIDRLCASLATVRGVLGYGR